MDRGGRGLGRQVFTFSRPPLFNTRPSLAKKEHSGLSLVVLLVVLVHFVRTVGGFIVEALKMLGEWA